MKIMTKDSSATVREETPHASNSIQQTISNSLRRRAQSVVKDRSIDAQSRALIRYCLEINDPWLAELVRRVDAGERIIDTIDFTQTPETDNANADEERIEALTEILCRAGDEPEIKAAALLVLMAAVENAVHPKAVANTAKHFAFIRCGELNLYGIVDAQIALIEDKMLSF